MALQELRVDGADLALASCIFLSTHAFMRSYFYNRHGQIISDARGVAPSVNKSMFAKVSDVLASFADLSSEQRTNLCDNIVPGRAMQLDIHAAQGDVCVAYEYSQLWDHFLSAQAYSSFTCCILQCCEVVST